ncbi:MAG: pyruvate:ferredoxin (flavodoxin) oxidoreductase [Clostridia bacterium]|nr:pyruvate:ferredoxin (flavodoxin) oxidoreductase [Clostridia bacterium]
MARKFKTMDGNNAAAHVSYAFTDVAAIYPITPSSVMAEVTDVWSAQGQKNIFGRPVRVAEMQSEGGAAGAVHGSLAAGALTTTYTASQGLLLMIPNMYKIAGELLPNVIHVSARALASHALSIFGDHSDVYACRQTGYAMLCSSSVQEVMDLGAVAHLSTIKGRVPFLHFFDGFRTSHEIQKIQVWDYEDLKDMVDFDAVERFRSHALNPEHPVQRGTAQNPDVFFQASEACNTYYDALPDIVEDYMNQVNAKIGTKYKLFNYYGARDAKHVIIAMGSVNETIEEVVDYLNAAGEKVGLIKVRLYRPFSVKHLIAALPKTVEKISVLDRTKEKGSIGEPLYLDVAAAIAGSKFAGVPVYSGRYGLGSKDTTPGQIVAVYRNMEAARPKKRFTIGIEDDVTKLSLKVKEDPDTTPKGTRSCKFWGLGSDGTVGANKNSIKIIGDHTSMYAQGYFAYDSKKSGGITISHLRFGKKPIKSTYLINKADFVACHNPSYVDKYDMVSDIKPGGTFLLNCAWDEEELDKHLPAEMKRTIARNNIQFYTLDATHLAKGLGLGNRTNTLLQAAFFKLAKVIPVADAVQYMKDAATKSYSKKGEAIVKMNHDAIETGVKEVRKVRVPASWKTATDSKKAAKAYAGRPEIKGYIDSILTPINAQQGDKLPVSTFLETVDGTVPLGSAAYEKRGIAVDVPVWVKDNCIQCNFCSYVCPHAVIRPVIMTADEAAKAPASQDHKPATGLPGMEFAMTISVLDCTGCGSCANVCPGMKGNKALVMKPLEEQLDKQDGFMYGLSLPDKEEVAAKFKDTTVKGSQFKQPLLEFSGACAGCGETPYAKLATQLFGDRMYIANATGCSSIWGGSAPSTPYTVNKEGKGPAWANSLFEDNAEYGYGMFLGVTARRQRLADLMADFAADDATAKYGLKDAAAEWLAGKDDAEASKAAAPKVVAALKAAIKARTKATPIYKEALAAADLLVKKSFWMLGGDGWSYDIGFGGVDHVLASGEDVNVLVFDTEVYSNTGGQASKATPTGSVAQFAAAGKAVKKKDLGAIAMSYGYVYVAQVSMGADMNQCLKAFHEAESYHGPSLIICYAPCINHGIKGGMGISQTEEKKAVEAGYWHLYRFDPRKDDAFSLDSKEPTASYQDFIMGEVRYNSLTRSFPDRAKKLFAEAEENAKTRYEHLVRLGELYSKAK